MKILLNDKQYNQTRNNFHLEKTEKDENAGDSYPKFLVE